MQTLQFCEGCTLVFCVYNFVQKHCLCNKNITEANPMPFKSCAWQIQIQVPFFWVCLYWIRLWVMKNISIESNVLMSMNLLPM